MTGRLRVDDVDLADLATWIDSRDYGAAYLDPATGEVYPAFEGEVLGADGEPVDLDEVKWVSIGGSSRGAYQDMEDFADAVGDPTIARQLWSALGGKGAFRRFREQMYRQPEEIREAWLRYRQLRAMSRAVDLLRDEHLVVDSEARSGPTSSPRRPGGPSTSCGSRPPPVRGSSCSTGCLGSANRPSRPGTPSSIRASCAWIRIGSARWSAGDPAENAESARVLALAMATAHLRSGHDVVVAQLLARPDQVERFAGAAAEAGASMVEVMLVDADGTPSGRFDRRRDGEEWQANARRPLAGADREDLLASFERGLDDVANARPATHRLLSRDGGPEQSYANLLELLDRRSP